MKGEGHFVVHEDSRVISFGRGGASAIAGVSQDALQCSILGWLCLCRLLVRCSRVRRRFV